MKRVTIMEDYNTLTKNKEYLQEMFTILKKPKEKKSMDEVELFRKMWRQATGGVNSKQNERTGMSEAEVKEVC